MPSSPRSSKITSKAVLLSGYYGFQNAGDEAILQGTVHALKEKGAGVIVLSHKPEETSQWLGIPSFPRKKLRDIIKGIQSSRVVLSGGGGLFQDKTSFRSLFYYLRIPFLAKLMGRKTMVFAQGIGPIETCKGKYLTRLVCNQFVDRITVRDQGSKELLQRIGVKKEIEVTADPAFLLPSPDQEQIAKIKARFNLDDSRAPFLGVVLREWKQGSLGMKSLLPEIGAAVSNFCKTHHATPVLVSFQPGDDDHLIKNLQAQMQVDHLVILETMTPAERVALSANFHFMLGMRYHALVFASIGLVPFIGINYDPKVEHFTHSLGFPVMGLDELSSSNLESVLTSSWETHESLKKILKEQLPLLRKKAETNISRVMELLGDDANAYVQ